MLRSTLIAISGPSGAGKTTLSNHLANALGSSATTILPVDAYYHDHSSVPPEARLTINYDSPEAIDITMLEAHLRHLQAGHSIARPQYDYRTHQRLDDTIIVTPERYVVIEGLMALYWPILRSLYDMTVFVTIPDEMALERRIIRDTTERARTEMFVRKQWQETVWPMYEKYVKPVRILADIVIDGTAAVETSVATLLATINEKDSPATSNEAQ